jgi:A/G-specific adenine glycosylase
MIENSNSELENYISDASIKAIRKRLLKWGKANFKNYPWRDTKKLWHALVAEVLLQRTRAGNVVEVYKEFVNRYKKSVDFAAAPLEEIESLLYPLGLPSRVPLLKQLGEALTRIDDNPPDDLENLLKLPAIGPYSAAAYMSFHKGKRAVIVDANVVRWICRLTDQVCDGETRRKKWMIELANKLTPVRQVREYNYAVLDFTMEICTSRPKCEICPIGPRLCIYGRKKLSENRKG